MLKKWSDVLTIVSGKNQKSVADPNGRYPIYGSGGVIGYAGSYLCEAGTTIVGRKGTINNPIFVNKPFWNVDTAFGISPGDELHPKYLYYFCCSFNFKELDKSTTIPSLVKRDLLQIQMPVPSLSEQERIVSKIEELFSKLDASVAELQTAKEKLKVYRQAVLKEAFRNVGKKVFLKSLFCGTPQNGVYKPKSAYGKGTRILRIDGFYDGFVTSEYEYKRLSLSEEEIEKYSLNQFDLVINRVNSMPYLGKCALIRHIPETTVFESNIMRVRLNPDVVSPEYVTYFLASDEGKRELTKNAKQAVNQASINQMDVGNALIPIPGDIVLQEQIVSVIERYLSVCASIEQSIDISLQQAEALRQSILKQAFEGRLV